MAPPGECLKGAGTTPRRKHTEALESQIERFAPGFHARILARHVPTPADLECRNPNLVGGDVGGGAMDLRQTLFRPMRVLYRTPVKGVSLCSSSTPLAEGCTGCADITRREGYPASRNFPLTSLLQSRNDVCGTLDLP